MILILSNLKKNKLIRFLYKFSILSLRLFFFLIKKIIYKKNIKILNKNNLFSIAQNAYELGYFNFINKIVFFNLKLINEYLNTNIISNDDRIKKTINDLIKINPYKNTLLKPSNDKITMNKYQFLILINSIIELENFGSVLNLINSNKIASEFYIFSLSAKNILRKNFNISDNLYFFPENFKSIGHSALISIFIKAKILRLIKVDNLIIVGQKHEYSNYDFLLSYKDFCKYKKNLDQISIEEKLCNSATLSGQLLNGDFFNFDHFHQIVQSKWEKNNKSLITLDFKTRKVSAEYFYTNFQLRKNAKFVVLHVRQNIYQKENLRDANIDTYIKTITFLNNLNIFVIRIGDNKMPQISYKNKLYIDLTNHSYGKHLSYLFENCLFSICTGSGPAAIHFLYNRYRLLTNWSPLLSVLSSKKTFLLIKDYFKSDNILTLNDRISEKYGFLENKKTLKREISYKNNSEDDILYSTMHILNLCKINFKSQVNINFNIKKLKLINSYELNLINIGNKYTD